MDSTAELISIDNSPELAVSQASKVFNSGQIFIYPTDTIYGIGADPFNKTSVDKVSKLKNRIEKKVSSNLPRPRTRPVPQSLESRS